MMFPIVITACTFLVVCFFLLIGSRVESSCIKYEQWRLQILSVR